MKRELSRKANARIAREKRTIRAMVSMYCRAHHHGSSVPCDECAGLLDYAERRIDSCRFIEDKPTCLRCPVHCYEKSRRESIRSVMRFAGPRMMYSHPVLAILHFADGRAGRKEGV